MANNKKGFPISHIVGFVLSLALTFIAVAVAFKTDLPAKTIVWIIGIMAGVQAVLQLFMFMHMNEGEDNKTQIINIAYGVFIALVTVVGSIWVMSFGGHFHL